MKQLLLCLFAIFFNTFTSVAQCVPQDIPSDCTTAIEEFDDFDGSGFSDLPSAGQLCSNQWAITGFSDGDLAFGASNASGDYARGTTDGGVTTGGIYSLDDGDNQAIWIQLGASDFTPGTLTYQICNNSGATLTSIDIAYDILVLNDQNRSGSFNFSYSTDDANYTPISALDYTSEEAEDTDPQIQIFNRNTTIENISLSDESCLFLRWTGDDVGGSGSRDEFGLDNIFVCEAVSSMDCSITNVSVENAGCQGEDYIFEVAFNSENSSGNFEIFNTDDNTVLANGNSSPITVTLIGNTSTTPFNIVVRDANDIDCTSANVEITPEDCTASLCTISSPTIQNEGCQDEDYVFEVIFNAENSSGSFEVVNSNDNSILASGNTSPITVTLSNNSSTTTFDIFVRDANETTCVSENIIITPEDCVTSCEQATANINEFHYDNDGGDTNEFVEIFIADPQPLDLSLYQIDLYNGANGNIYETTTLDATTATVGTNGTFYVWEEVLQNGPDGIALSGLCGLIEFISYEGSFAGSEGIADGITSTDIGVAESTTEAEQSSIQLIDGVWQVTSGFNTKGAENALPPCQITNISIQNAGCQGENYVFEVVFDAVNSSGDFEVINTADNAVLASGNASPITVTLIENTSTTPFNFIVRDANDNDCASESVEVTPEDCTPPPCQITNISIQNAGCQGINYVFEVAFDAENSSGNFEIINAADNAVLASGNASPITVTLIGNTTTTPFNIIVRDANDNDCASESVEVTPEDCTPLICAIDNVSIQNASCQNEDYVFEVAFDAVNSSGSFEVINTSDNAVLAGGNASPITVTLVGNTSTTPFNIIIRDANDNDCASASVEFTPEDCSPLVCANVGDLVITEIMQNPDAVADGNGEWFEIYNPTNDDIDLQGYIIRDAGSNSHEIQSSVIVPATGYAVLGNNADMATNGGVPVDYEYSSFTLTNTDDEVLIECGGIVIDSVGYDGGTNFPNPTGASISLNPNNLNATDNDNGENWCEASTTFGDGDLGTPGTANDACPQCTIANVSIQNAGCQGEDYVFEIAFDAENSSGDFEVVNTDDNSILATGNTSPILVTLVGNTSTTPFNIIIRDANDNDCASESVEVTPEDCTPPPCQITDASIQNAGCQGINYVFEVAFGAENSSGNFEVINADDNSILASGNASPITVTLIENTSTTPFNIIVRDANDNDCASESVEVTPEDCTPLICAIDNVSIQNAGCQGENYVFEIAFDAVNSSGDFEVVNAVDNSILASGNASPITVTLIGNTITTPFNIIIRDANDNDCASESVEVTPEDCKPLICAIDNVSIQNAGCQGENYVFEIAFDAVNSSGDFEVVNAVDNSILASGNASPITVTLIGNTSITPFNIIVRDANDNDCASASVEVTPEDCSPLVCANVGDLVITEIMQNPDAVADGNGEWFEIYNPTNDDIDLQGYIIRDAGSNSHEIQNSVIVPATGYAVLGNNADMATNGGVPVDYEYSSFTLGNTDDEVIIECSGIVIDSVGYDGGTNFPNPTGASISLNPNNLNATDNDNGENWCEASTPFGDGDLGTPGTANDACPQCMITNIAIQNAGCQGINYVFEVVFDAVNSSGDFEVINTADNAVLASGNASPITVTLIENTSTTPFNIIVRDANDNDCASESVEVTPEDCTPLICAIDNVSIQNASCQDEDYVFEVAFDAVNSSGSFEVINTSDNAVLASGNASSITVILVENTSTTPFNIIVRDANDNDCASESVEVTPEDCTPPCQITNITVQNAVCQNTDYIFEVAFESENSSGSFEVVNIDDNSILATENASPITVTLNDNTNTSSFNIIVRDANNATCASESIEVIPEDCVASCEQAIAHINEFHYDNIGTDINEFVEIFIPNPQPTDLNSYRITLYNGANGNILETITLDATTATTGINGTFYVWEETLQNGPDGIALSGPCGLIEFISYEGSFIGNEGVAEGVTSMDIGAAESMNEEEQSSIQLINGIWQVTSGFNTKGEENALPPCNISNVVIQNGSCQDADYVFEVAFDVENGSGNFEVYDIDGDSVLASGNSSPILVTLVSNTNTTTLNIIVRDANNQECISESAEVMPEDCTPLVCVNTGDLVITEIIQNPAAVSDANGEWFEIYNSTASAIDLRGYIIRDADGDIHEISSSTIIAANGYAVLGRNSDITTNGGVVVDYEYSGFTLDNGFDEVIIECNSIVIDSVGYDDGSIFPDPTGASMSLNPDKLNAIDNDNGENWCEASTPFGDGDLGTPGAANDVCPECIIANISIQNAACQDADYVFEVTFDAENSSGDFEVFNADDNAVLATGNTSPILVTLVGNTSTTPFNIIIRDANDPECISKIIEITPEDCTPLICVNIGDLVITEIMSNPDVASDTNGEWFEIYNNTSQDIDLKGYVIRDAEANSHEIATSVIVPAEGYAVLGRNADQSLNGGVQLDYEYSSFVLGNEGDEIIIECLETVIDSVSYDAGTNFPNPEGASISLNPNNLNAIDNDNGENWCEASTPFGDGDLGTPGKANDACPECRITNISIQNERCEDTDFIFEVAFDAIDDSGNYEVVDTATNEILASGNSSPIIVTLFDNTSNINFNIIVRDAEDEDCRSEVVEVDAKNCVDECDIVINNIESNPPFCIGNDDGSIVVNTSSSLNLEYSIDGTTFQNSPVFKNLTAGTYTISIRTPQLDDCQIDMDITVEEGATIDLKNILVENENCPNDEDGSITIIATFANSELLYSIDGGATFQANNTFNNLAPDTYEIVVKSVVDDFCSQNFGTVTIAEGKDIAAPTFTCPDNLTVGTDADKCGAVIQNIELFNVTDNCDATPMVSFAISGELEVPKTAGNANGITFPQGTSTVTYFIEDKNGNLDSCKFNVTVEDDDTPIVMNCPSDIIINDATEFYRNGGIITWTPPSFSDNCTDVNDLMIENNLAPGFIPDLGITSIFYTATDEAGNSSSCTFNIILRDIYITDPCTCLDNRTNGSNGQFAETITVFSAPDETWRITSVSGLFMPPTGNFPPASGISYDLVPYEIGDLLLESPSGSGIYILNALHLEGEGYSITISNGSASLSTSNSCNYDISCNGDIALGNDGGAPKSYNLDCGKTTGFFDDGGFTRPYSDENIQSDIVIICPENPATQVVKIVFNQFDLASNDFLVLYDGDNLAAPKVGNSASGSSVAGAPNGGWLEASCENRSGCLTFEFIRNGDQVKGAGWEATLSCEARDNRFVCATQTEFIYYGNECNSFQNIHLPLPEIELCGAQLIATVAISCDLFEYQIDTAANVLNIPNLPVGRYNIRLSDPIYPERFCDYVLKVIPSNLVCNDDLNISLLNECTVALTPDLILENPCQSGDIEYELSFTDPNINLIGTTLSGYPIADFSTLPCGTKIEVKIKRTIFSACGDAYEDICWSNIILEDKTAPTLIGGIDEYTLNCYENSDDLLDKLRAAPQDGSAFTIDLNFDNKLNVSAVENEFSFTENCSAGFDLSNWQEVDYDCTTGAFIGFIENAADPLWALMAVENGEEAVFKAYFRVIKAIDNCGNESNIGIQRIIVVQPDIVFPLLEIELPCEASTNPQDLYNLWASGDPKFAHYATFLPNFDPTPLDVNGNFGGFSGLDDNYFTDNSGDEIPASLAHENCGYAIDWEDSDSIEICENTYKFFRELTVYNWCDGHLELLDVIPQVVKVVDTQNPKLEFIGILGTNSSNTNCSANAIIEVAISDDCGGDKKAYVDFLNDGFAEAEFELIDGNILVSNVPIGDSLQFTIRLTDDCGNSDTFGTFYTILEDNIPPTVICESFRTIALGIDCSVEIPAESFDDGSYDNCGQISFSVARMSDITNDGFLFDEDFDFFFEGDQNVFQPTLKLTGEDLEADACSSSLQVIFRVEDGAGNANFCMTTVEIADKLPPICTPMPDFNATCFDPIVADLTELLLLDEAAQLTHFADLLSNGTFGTLTVEENCGSYTIEVLDLDLKAYNLECNQGTITYKFRAMDNCGYYSNICKGDIVVDGDFHDWVMDFPRDRIVRCDDRFVNFRIPRPSDLDDILTNNGCDEWKMEVTTERFDNASEGCYELVYTYNLVNWCTWNPQNIEPAVVERPDSILDDRFETMSLRYRDIYINDDPFTTCSVQRSLDDCEIVLSPLGRDGINDIDDFCDDGDESFTNLQIGCDGDFVLFELYDRPYSGDITIYDIFSEQKQDTLRDTRYVSAQEYGNIIYRQVIRVYDATAPIVEVADYPSVFCGGENEVQGDLCTAQVEIEFSVSDACLPAEDLNVSYQLLPFNGTAINDPFGSLENLGDGNYRITGNYPIQAGGDSTAHSFFIRIEDDCFNSEEINIQFTVVDCKAPTPYCIFGLSADFEENGTVTLWASDFDAGSFDFCTSPDSLKLTFADPSIYPDSTSRTFQCRDGEVGVVAVELWVQDLAGNTAFCETFVSLKENEDCPTNSSGAAIAGIVINEQEEGISDVAIHVSGNGDYHTQTGERGTFTLANRLEIAYDYTITPHKNDDPMNGVSTYDLVLISKHILNAELLDSPYKIIAADVNRSGSITTFDMILLRKLILGIDDEFESNTSWRFVAADYAFRNPSRPLQENFPEVISLNDVSSNYLDANFVGVKVGDVNGSAIPNANTIENRSIQDTFLLQVQQRQLEQNLYQLDFEGDLNQLEGYQFTLNFDEKELELIEIVEATAKNINFGLSKLGKVTVSWNGTTTEKEAFSLIFRTHKNTDFEKALQLNSSITKAEAYTKTGNLQTVALTFQGKSSAPPLIILHQNTPNPFTESTLIAFELGQTQKGVLEIRDVNGKLVYHLEQEFQEGRNELKIKRKDLISGVLFYSLEVDGVKETRRMVLL